MLATADLRILTRWCRNRRLNWLPAAAVGGAPAITLMPVGRRAPWQEMLLVAREDDFCLRDAPGATLATASDLPALLDALDAGVAVPERPPYASGRFSGPGASGSGFPGPGASEGWWPTLRNSVESAIT
jgi:hypothetical protein